MRARQTALSMSVIVFTIAWALTNCAYPVTPTPQENGGGGVKNEWSLQIQDNSTVLIANHNAPVIKAEYLFWAENWKWAGSKFEIQDVIDGKRTFTGKVPNLGLQFSGIISNDPPHILTYAGRITADRDLSGITGGGLEFRLELNASSFSTPPPMPVLLPDKKGWQWTVDDGTISVEFSESIPDVYFERGNKGIIRVMLVGKELRQGIHPFTMRVVLPKGSTLRPSVRDRYGVTDTQDWYRDVLPWNAAPVDLSYLNHKPAGSRGFVRAQGDQFVFEDGSPVRFWGGVLAAYTLFSEKPRIEEQSHRIAQLGYNLMRIHHHDSMSWSPAVIDKKLPDSQHLDLANLDKLDYWIKCLKDQGVYIWLDLHVGRQFKEGDNNGVPGGILGFDEIARHEGAANGFCYYNEILQKLMRDFNEKYLTHVNPYTGLAYKDDPAIMGVLITNENDLTHHYGNLMLKDKNNPVHNAVFEQAVKTFCVETGLPARETWKTWVPGPSKIFLNNQEHLFNRTMIDPLRKLGVKAPIATTNYWAGLSSFSLPALSDSDMIDVHSYGNSEALESNPRYVSNYATRIAGAHLYGKPLSVTEWNVPYPATDRFTAPIYVAGMASLQGWNAIMVYNYAQVGIKDAPQRPDTWSTFNDPALTGLMPAAALAYRQGHISLARKTYCLKLDRAQTYYQATDDNTSAAIRTLAETSRITLGLPDVPELKWDSETHPAEGVEVLTDPARDFIPSGQNYVESDTGELKRDWIKGIYTVNAPKTQAVSGWIGGEIFDLQDIGFRIQTRKATVVVTSLDDHPIRQSRKILISAVARVLVHDGKLPFLSEPVAGKLTIKASPGMKAYPLKGDGTRGPLLDVQEKNGVYTLSLERSAGTHWYILE